MIIKNYDSFSNYLAKQKNGYLDRNSPLLRKKIKCFGLDEIVNQIASPKKLAKKLETD